MLLICNFLFHTIMYSANTTIKYICIIAKFEVYINYIFHKIKPQISLIMTISKKPPGVTSTERLLHRFSCRMPGKIIQLEHLNYIISGTSWQGVYFLYPFIV